MNKEFTRMQKLAGLMTEGLYTSDEKAPMEAMSHGSESKMKKSDFKKKIKEMMLSEETPEEMAYAAVDSMDEASYEGSERMDGLAPVNARKALLSAARMIIAALKRDGFEEEDIHDYLLDLITTLPSEEDLFEAKKDEEADTEDVIVADTEEVPAEDAAVDVTADDTQVDVNMDGVPDVDTGSAESKKAFTSLVDTYNASKELGDPKLTQMIANALTYYNKNIILKAGQPQA
jgi:hypothetical protein